VEELGTNSNSSSNYGTVNVVARMIQQYQYQQQHGADAPKSGSRAKLVASSAAAIGSDSSGVSSGASGPMSPEYVAMAFQVLPQEREEGEGVAGHRGEASDSSNYSEMKKARLARAAADSTQTATPTTISAHNAPSDIASGVITGAGGSKHGSTFTSELFSAISAHLDKTYRAMHNGSSNRGGLKETGNSNDFDASDYDDISLGIGFLVQVSEGKSLNSSYSNDNLHLQFF
jgi:single-stranded DNA-binding protein